MISPSWTDPALRIKGDSVRTSRYRALQGWFRETVLGVPPGRDRRGRLVSSMLPAEMVAGRPGLNFLTREAAQYAAERGPAVLTAGGTMDLDRLRRNMLSSMPMCFNFMGYLRTRPELPQVLRLAFGVDAATVESAVCEWAPVRSRYLNDRTAFDAFVVYRNSSGQRCFLAVETKYTEPFSQREYDSALYQHVTASSGMFRTGAGGRLVGRATNQLWRMAMLAASLLQGGAFGSGSACVLSLEDDPHAKRAVEGVRSEVVDDAFVRLVSFESLTTVTETFSELAAWARSFRTRYLDLTPLGGV